MMREMQQKTVCITEKQANFARFRVIVRAARQKIAGGSELFLFLWSFAADMLCFYNFIRLFRKHRFAQALASLSPGSKFFLARQHYALYRLGMYRSVACLRPVRGNWRSFFAVIASSVACGDKEQVLQFLRDKEVLQILEQHRMNLAKALLAFLPEEAARLLPAEAPQGITAALALAVGDRAKALSSLAVFVNDPGAAVRDPDLFLLCSNASESVLEERLEYLNSYLAAHGLTSVCLKNPASPPGAMNLAAAGGLLVLDGPLVSILMTAFSSAKRIGSAIESLLQQSYRNVEVIVVDDASADETAQVVQALARRDARVRYIRLPVNVGTYVAKSIGLQRARGGFVTCHDSDDWAHPEKIALQVAPLLEDAKLVFSTSQMVRIRDDGFFYARQIYPLTRLNSSSVLFRKKQVLDQCGGWDLVRTGADSEFLARLKIVFGSHAMRRINKPLSFCAHRPDSLMTQASTGYDANRMSPIRLDYWESFSAWHIEELRQGRLPRLGSGRGLQRPFPVPESIAVPSESIKCCMSVLGLDSL